VRGLHFQVYSPTVGDVFRCQQCIGLRCWSAQLLPSSAVSLAVNPVFTAEVRSAELTGTVIFSTVRVGWKLFESFSMNFDLNYEWSLFPIYTWMRDRYEHQQTLNEAGG
jgi:hypothetical protein